MKELAGLGKAKLLRARYKTFTSQMREALTIAIEIGDYLAHARKLVGVDVWGTWVEQNCGMSKEVAGSFIRLYHNEDSPVSIQKDFTLIFNDAIDGYDFRELK
jgi:hypothetical protein